MALAKSKTPKKPDPITCIQNLVGCSARSIIIHPPLNVTRPVIHAKIAKPSIATARSQLSGVPDSIYVLSLAFLMSAIKKTAEGDHRQEMVACRWAAFQALTGLAAYQHSAATRDAGATMPGGKRNGGLRMEIVLSGLLLRLTRLPPPQHEDKAECHAAGVTPEDF